MYAVVVTLTLRPGAAAEFMPLMLENARASRAQEPGCRQFDVCTDPERPDEVFLYELYDDRAAFEAHLATPHFAAFDAASAPLVASKEVRSYAQVAR